MKIIELFSGIGGFAEGFRQAGYEFTEHYFSEIDKHAIANYKYNFEYAKHIGSVTDIRGEDYAGIDIITFGSPCQDFSLAGKREGLQGAKSSLITEAINIIAHAKPSFFIWENVKGTFSSNAGADFWAILQAFTNIGGYRLEWQLLNTRWFLPQNRERIYLVGHLATAGTDFRPVLSFGENDQFSERTQEKQTAEIQTKSCATIIKSSGSIRPADTFVNAPKIAACLTGGGHSGGLHSDITTIEVGTFRTYNRNKGFRKTKENIAPTIPARAREDGSGQLVIKQLARGNNKGADFEICPTISCNSFQENNFVSGLRRLTEIECERLQGFSDDWTKLGNYDGTFKEIAKTQRYKLIGNAVSVPVVKAIAERLKQNYLNN